MSKSDEKDPKAKSDENAKPVSKDIEYGEKNIRQWIEFKLDKNFKFSKVSEQNGVLTLQSIDPETGILTSASLENLWKKEETPAETPTT